MAIYHCSVKVVSRSSGRSAVGSAAYRSGEKLTNERDGITHDYTRKTGIEYTEIMLPDNAPKEYQNRETLWNAVEKIEKGDKAQLAREYEIALPKELSRQEQIDLVRGYVKDNFTSKGMCADICIHSGHKHRKGKEIYEDGIRDKDIKPENPHAHIMLTMRQIEKNGEWGTKQKKEYILDKNGNKQYDKKKQTYKCNTVKTTNWDDKQFLKDGRKDLADRINARLKEKGIADRVDHRSYKDQGIEKEPMIHLGSIANEMEKRGVKTDRGDINRKVAEQNMEYEVNKKEVAELLQERTERELREQRPTQSQGEPSEGIGLIKNVDRSDQQATREIQRSGGLGIEEHFYAKAEEMNYQKKKVEKPEERIESVPSKRMDGNSPVASKRPHGVPEKTVEQTAESLNHLKTEYFTISKQIRNQKEQSGKLHEEGRRNDSDIKRINDYSKELTKTQVKIDQAKEQRANRGPFEFKGKKMDAENIQSLEKSKNQGEENFRRTLGIEPEQATAATRNLGEKARAIQEQKAKLPDVSELKEKQKEIEIQYKTERVYANIHPEREKIDSLVKRQPGTDKESIIERMDRVKSEQNLNTISPEEYKKIMEKAEPEKAEKIANTIKDKDEYKPEQSRSHERER